MISSETREFAVTFAAGLDPLVRSEINAFGGVQVAASAGALSFQGTLETAYRLCLWSRFASRVLFPIVSSVSAPDGKALQEASNEVDWENHFGPEETFAVSCTGRGAGLANTHYAALCVKDGIADRFNRILGRRPSVDTREPDIRIHAFLEGDRATFSLDLSGGALHRRGYRVSGGEAPLKESLAAAIVALSSEPLAKAAPASVVDPMCGSGTLLIEAVLLMGDVAPGLLRRCYGFTKWRGHDPRLWDRLLLEARDRRERGRGGALPRFTGYDAGRGAVVQALQNIERAEIEGLVHVEKREIAFLSAPLEAEAPAQPRGLILVNPPYGERLADSEALPYLYRCLGRKLRETFPGWTAGVFTARAAPSDALGMEPMAQHSLYNGAIPCVLQVFQIPAAPLGAPSVKLRAFPVPETKARGELADRLRKNLRIRSKWATGESVPCFRLYDADLPQYNAAIDLYEDHVRIREYPPPASVGRESAVEHMNHVVTVVQEVLGAGRDDLFIARSPGPGKRPPRSVDKRPREVFHEVGEDGCRFLVNLSHPRDPGFPLEQRTMRRLIRVAAPGKRVLNLFCASGTATIQAAMGGAKTSVSVDDSDAWISWARKHLLLNGLSEENHRLVVANAVEWVSRSRETFDLIFSDMTGRFPQKGKFPPFDAGKDALSFLRACVGRMAEGGITILTTRDRRFRLGQAALRGIDIQEITQSMVPPDFKRTPRIHRVWRIVRPS